MTLPWGESATSLWLTNTGDRGLDVQAQVFNWQQRDGEEALTPTAEVGLSPPHVQIPPGQRQRLRVVRLPAQAAQTAQPGGLHSYRIIVDKQPAAAPTGAASDAASERLRLSLPLPLFVLPAQALTPTVAACVFAQPAPHTGLRLRNTGGGYAKVVDLAYQLPQSPPLPDTPAQMLMEDLAGYVLPGSFKHWQLDGTLQHFVGASLHAQINGQGQTWVLQPCADE